MPGMRHMLRRLYVRCPAAGFVSPNPPGVNRQASSAMPAAAVVCRDNAMSICFIPRKQISDFPEVPLCR
jgi:hypothetical protein